MRPGVFFDRDDTLIACGTLPDDAWASLPPGAVRGDLLDPSLVRLLPGVREGLGLLRDAGFAVVVITNQGGVARSGRLDLMELVHDRLLELASDAIGTALIDAVYACPMHPDAPRRAGAAELFVGEHPWRKPAPGMIVTAAAELGLHLPGSWLVGDAERDVRAGVAAGIHPERCLRVAPGEGIERAVSQILIARDDPAMGFEPRVDESWSGPAPARTGGTWVGPGAPELVPATVAVLRAVSGEPLAEEHVRQTVESTARAIAERTGVRVLAVSLTAASISVTLATHRLGAIGFAGELRRLTNAWYAGRTGGGVLWPSDERRAGA